jgi:Flp pilus assembly protein TadG
VNVTVCKLLAERPEVQKNARNAANRIAPAAVFRSRMSMFMSPAPIHRNAVALARSRDGAAAVEFALLAPLLALMLAGLIDVSRLVEATLQVRAAAQAGAAYARAHGWDATAIAAAVTAATPLAASATPAPQTTTACVAGGAIIATAGTTCASGAKPGQFITVSASAPFKALVPGPHRLALPAQVTAQAVVRTR